ncbi:hypothetical protein ONZ45_g10285 [Pleurotus djamor]|nr:hypothetical protein ONZ45_g10285 [Pleurotus djamor]
MIDILTDLGYINYVDGTLSSGVRAQTTSLRLATIALAHSQSSTNGISPALFGSVNATLRFLPVLLFITFLGIDHHLNGISRTPFAPFSSHIDHLGSNGFSGSMGMGIGGGLAGMGVGGLAGMGVPSIDDGLYGGDMNVCGGGNGRGYDDETSHWTQMQNALNGNGVFDYTNPAERFVEPAPHSSHVNNNLLNATPNGSFGAQAYAAGNGGSGGYDGMYGFNKGLDAFSFSSSMSSMDVDMFNSSSSSSSFPNPSSSHPSFPNADGIEGNPHGASEAEMAAYEWEHSPTSFSSSSTGFLPDDFDISAIPPIEIGLPKFGVRRWFEDVRALTSTSTSTTVIRLRVTVYEFITTRYDTSIPSSPFPLHPPLPSTLPSTLLPLIIIIRRRRPPSSRSPINTRRHLIELLQLTKKADVKTQAGYSRPRVCPFVFPPTYTPTPRRCDGFEDLKKGLKI